MSPPELTNGPMRRKTGRPRSLDPAVTVSFSLPRTIAEQIDLAIIASDATSRSAWFREAVAVKLGTQRTTPPTD